MKAVKCDESDECCALMSLDWKTLGR